MPVQQSGSVTPGHLAVWTTDGVVQDGGSVIASQRVLATLFSADFNSVADQPIVMPPTVTAFALTGLLITNASISLSSAVGGFYTAASKGGSAIVSAGQAYSTLTDEDLLLNATLTAFAQSARFSSANLGLVLTANSQFGLAFYLSLTTPQGMPATADIYALGLDLSP